MSEQERRHIADLLSPIIVRLRQGELDGLDGELSHVQWLLDHPGWQVNRPTNFEEAA